MKAMRFVLLGMVALFGLAVDQGRSCSCDRQSTVAAYNDAEVVFEGAVTGIEGAITSGSWPAGTVHFSVRKVWKGTIPLKFEMPAVVVGGSCLGFYSFLLKPGNELLVYARRTAWTPTGDKAYFTNACAGTKLLRNARADRTVLQRISGTAKRNGGSQEASGARR